MHLLAPVSNHLFGQPLRRTSGMLVKTGGLPFCDRPLPHASNSGPRPKVSVGFPTYEQFTTKKKMSAADEQVGLDEVGLRSLAGRFRAMESAATPQSSQSALEQIGLSVAGWRSGISRYVG